MTQLLRTAIPVVSAHAPGVVMGREHADAAIAAVKASAGFSNVQGLTLPDGLDMLTDANANLKSSRIFEENVNRLRGELYVGGHDDPQRRFELHQLLMVAGFYARAANMHSTKADPVRFLANHYNFDVRRDKSVLHAVKDVAFNDAATPATNDLLGELLETERHLFGQHRLQPIGGKQYMMPGVAVRHIKTEEELLRLLALEPVVKHGNFETVIVPDDKRVTSVGSGGWKTTRDKEILITKQDRWDAVLLKCKPEPEPPIAPPTKLYSPDEEYGHFRLRVLRPPPPMSWAEKMREVLLQVWVYWFSFWALFWMVDEEVIAFIGLIYARYKQLAFLQEEAKRSHSKVYMATSKLS
uniref:Uncharacterized protein n=1 Tax=Neobodo designis TaxID=312471 RepID=A0A7S1R6J8_NEODS|mmetsp:Transcript_959/g.3226  ORF Transcript_959/g.3226 Transcript_959/m.3226 type:complete len:354 (+) Transcript_959:155-1216(+)